MNLEQRFNQKYIPVTESGCWIWTDACFSFGYGRIKENGKSLCAHRVSFEIHKGSIPKGLFVCHKCNVPQCVNPDHLYLGTHQDNMDDRTKTEIMNSSELAKFNFGSKNGRSKLNEDMVEKIYLSDLSTKELSENYGVSLQTITRIKSGERWTHVTGKIKKELG